MTQKYKVFDIPRNRVDQLSLSELNSSALFSLLLLRNKLLKFDGNEKRRQFLGGTIDESLQRACNPTRKKGGIARKTKDWKGQRVCHLLISKLRLMNEDFKASQRERARSPDSSRSRKRLDRNTKYTPRCLQSNYSAAVRHENL